MEVGTSQGRDLEEGNWKQERRQGTGGKELEAGNWRKRTGGRELEEGG